MLFGMAGWLRFSRWLWSLASGSRPWTIRASEPLAMFTFVVFLDERDFQSKLTGADCGGVTGGAGANDGNVIDRLWQRSAPYWDECGVLDKQMIVVEVAIHG